MIPEISTIGYSGFSLDEFVQKLQEAEIECLIDVREIPLSRKRGFSKTALGNRLEEDGIGYRHFKLLGSPKSLRREVQETKNFGDFFLGVHRHLSQDEPSAQVAEVIAISRRVRSCLMCCCADWQFCHRRCVVEKMAKKFVFNVSHLGLVTATSFRRRAA